MGIFDDIRNYQQTSQADQWSALTRPDPQVTPTPNVPTATAAQGFYTGQTPTNNSALLQTMMNRSRMGGPHPETMPPLPSAPSTNPTNPTNPAPTTPSNPIDRLREKIKSGGAQNFPAPGGGSNLPNFPRPGGDMMTYGGNLGQSLINRLSGNNGATPATPPLNIGDTNGQGFLASLRSRFGG